MILTQDGFIDEGSLLPHHHTYDHNGSINPIIGIRSNMEPLVSITTRRYEKMLLPMSQPIELNKSSWKWQKTTNQWRPMRVSELFTHDLKKDHSRFYWRTNSPLGFEGKPLPIDPYVMGQLLGDGGMSAGSIILTTNDPETLTHIQGALGECYCIKPTTKKIETISYRITYEKEQKRNPLMESIRQMGLNITSEHKFIPPEYLMGSLGQRMGLLWGLMDSDGTCTPNGTHYSFTTVSERLKDDFLFLTRSLGGTPSVSQKIPFYRKNGKKILGKLAYSVYPKLPNQICPFMLERKKLRWERKFLKKIKYAPYRIIETIEPAPEGLWHWVETKNGSYIGDNFCCLIG